MITTEFVYERLKTVIDPETRINVVDMGLIRDVTVEKKTERVNVSIFYTLTTPACPLAGTFPVLIWNSLRDVVPDFVPERDVAIELTFDPPWSVEDLSEEARATLDL